MSSPAIKIEVSDHHAWMLLGKPPYNALNTEVLEEILAASRELRQRGDVWTMALASSTPGYFCNGLDPAFLLALNVDGRLEAFRKLIEMMLELYTFPRPMLAVIDGFAMAGGAVLGILADFRLMSTGKYRYSFYEANVGLTLTESLLAIVESVVGPAHVARTAMLAEAYKPQDALAIGLVDEIHAPEKLTAAAHKLVAQLHRMPSASLSSIKENRRTHYVQLLKKDLKLEGGKFRELLGSFNFEEGLTAVLENRRPKFRN